MSASHGTTASLPEHLHHNATMSHPYVWRVRLGDGTRAGRHRLAFFNTASPCAITAQNIATQRFHAWPCRHVTFKGMLPRWERGE